MSGVGVWVRFVIQSKKLWSVFAAGVLAVMVGCGGGGSDSSGDSGSTAGGTGTVAVGPTPLLSTRDSEGRITGVLEFSYLTGDGRNDDVTPLNRSQGDDITAYIKPMAVSDDSGTVFDGLQSTKSLLLIGYQHQKQSVNIPFSSQSSRLFNTGSFTVEGLEYTDTRTAISVPSQLPYTVTMNAKVFPGRFTILPVFLDSSVLYPVGTTTVGEFDQLAFEDKNYTDGGAIRSFISDYLSFDLSRLPAANRPLLTDGTAASRVMFSGDNIAIGEPLSAIAGAESRFEVLRTDELNPIQGRYKPPARIGSVRTPGTYTLLSADPSDPNPDPSLVARITSIQGIWRDHDKMISGMSSFEIIALPNSTDGDEQDIVAVVQTVSGSGSTATSVVTNLYFGTVNYDTASFSLFPVRGLVNANVGGSGALDGEITGTITSLLNRNGGPASSSQGARYADYQFAAGALPSGFKSTGRLVIFRG